LSVFKILAYKIPFNKELISGITPKHSQMNAKVEKANRTSKEEFLDYNLSDLFYNLDRFNQKLMGLVNF
jgi:hypothetical protein